MVVFTTTRNTPRNLDDSIAAMKAVEEEDRVTVTSSCHACALGMSRAEHSLEMNTISQAGEQPVQQGCALYVQRC